MENQQTSISIIKAPLMLGASYDGCQFGPDKFLEVGIDRRLAESGASVSVSEVACPAKDHAQRGSESARYAQEIANVGQVIAQQVKNAIESGSRPVVLGGDHSLNLGAFAGAKAASDQTSKSIGMIYIDAHGDMNTPESTPSGNVHGMHLAALMGIGPEMLVSCGGMGAKLAPDNLLHLGASDLDQFEIDLMDQQNIASFSIDDILTKGMQPMVDMIKYFGQKLDQVWVSFDLDVMNQNLAPGVGIPNQGGLERREIDLITRTIASSCSVIGVDISECNPPRDSSDNRTAVLGAQVAQQILGLGGGGYYDYLHSG